MMWDGGTHMFGGGGLGIGITEIVLLSFFGTLILVGIVLVVMWATRRGPSGTDTGLAGGRRADDPAAGIARERFARGEITAEELDEMLRTLSG